MKLRVTFIHGNGGGTGDDHWFPSCAAALELAGYEVVRPNFPDAMLARADYWLPYLKDELMADENTVLVGHSSGAIAAMRYAETNKLYGSVLVGAYYTDTGDASEKLSGYFEKPWNWDAIKRNQHWIIQFASTDDPYIPVTEARLIHERLRTEYYEYTDQGHFGTGDNPKTEFPELVHVVLSKLGAQPAN